jgi:hypothetical protein
MPELASYIGIEPRTASNQSGSTIGRGLRVLYGATGLITLAGVGVRGDYVTLQDIANNDVGLVTSLSGGGKVGAVASVAVSQGDVAQAAANGQFAGAGAAPILGKWTTAVSGAGVLGEVELESVV